ncbi:hypothetical protein ATANTOWER_008554 [Ataeniobius toweri]|uniref:Uncharacterized protein n=1 Tax=Ataeniobius toweri TaxID=208326 RepID=A0ABU7BNH5_9TELE|nr:hypothetical protein [Ataeniobius toweri]
MNSTPSAHLQEGDKLGEELSRTNMASILLFTGGKICLGPTRFPADNAEPDTALLLAAMYHSANTQCTECSKHRQTDERGSFLLELETVRDFELEFSIDAPGDILMHTSNSQLRVSTPEGLTKEPKPQPWLCNDCLSPKTREIPFLFCTW